MKEGNINKIGAVITLVAIAINAVAACSNTVPSGNDAQTACTNCSTGKQAPNNQGCTWHSSLVYSDAYCGQCSAGYNCSKTGSHGNSAVYTYAGKSATNPNGAVCSGGSCTGGGATGSSIGLDSNSQTYCGS